MTKSTITPYEKPDHPLETTTKHLKPNYQYRLLGIALSLGLMAVFGTMTLKASDHDDGEVDTKGRNLNLTDLYVFREKDQNQSAADGNLVFIMNTNPRSLARQQYFFSTRALYEFKVSRVANNDATTTTKSDVVLRFEFSPPNANNQQQFKVTALRDGGTYSATGMTTALNPNPNNPPNINNISLGGANFAIFAGLREDPFFFDVEQYFRVRAGALGIGPAVGFRPTNTALDFAKGYNVNAIAVRVPIKFLQGSTTAKTFDVWQTISVPGLSGRYIQVEQLGRPGVNEALLFNNESLNTYNRLAPAGTLPAPVVAEAKNTLLKFGNNDSRANTLLGAFVPDVMRIDTTKPSGYLNAVNAKGSPITGRLLLDDIVDQTLTVLTNGAIKTDNVSYTGTPGNAAQGHKPLVTSFPYLALPN
jgi:hypothetical protein